MATPADSPEDQLNISPLDIASRMEVLASEGEWDEIEKLSLHLRDSVNTVPLEKRRDVWLALQRSNDLVQSMVTNARRDVKEQLSSIRRGRDAAKAYGVTNNMAGR